MDPNTPRLIEVGFPLKQVSLDSVHEKNVRHGHISTLHIWPARRPLAACRAALIATLLPDPGDKEKRDEIYRKLAGRVVTEEKDGSVKETTEGGILHWGRESGPDLDWFREEIKKAYGGRAPRVMDPFAGGGAIPLEAMRLGCEVTAIDINPVAWFILKCTLEYPQKLAGQKRPLPDFIVGDEEFMELFRNVTGQTKPLSKKGRKRKDTEAGAQISIPGTESSSTKQSPAPEAELSWHIRAWGQWVLEQAKEELKTYYPIVNDRSTVAYLWARIVKCKHCRAALPLLKTRWLCKKAKKRVLLTMTPNDDRSAVVFGVQDNVALPKGNSSDRKDADKQVGAGTMSKAGARCPCCNLIMSGEDIRLEAQAGRLDERITAVIVDGRAGKEYRLPTSEEFEAVERAQEALFGALDRLPFGVPAEPIPKGASRKGGGSAFTVHLYGRTTWGDMFNKRQLLSAGIIAIWVRSCRQQMSNLGYNHDWITAISGYLYAAISRLVDRNSELCTWQINAEKIGHTFARYALPITWDYVEVMPWADSSGGFIQGVAWVAKVAEHLCRAASKAECVTVLRQSAIAVQPLQLDVIVTDPPYYDAIPYSDLMDFFYIFLKRTMLHYDETIDAELQSSLSPKWDHTKGDGELIDDAGRHGGDNEKSKRTYEEGMGRAFQACHSALAPEGRLVVVFAHKQPDAWETLVAAIIRAGFVVDGTFLST